MLLSRFPHALVGLTAIAGLAATTPAQAADAASRSVTLSAAHARIADLAGELEVVVEDRSDVRLAWSGPKRWVEAVQPRLEGATAVLVSPAIAGGGSSVSANNVSVFSSGGGTASVTIGGQTYKSGGDEPAVKAEIRLPRNADLAVSGMTGQCRIGALSGKLTLQMRAGTCILAGLAKGADLTIDGSGSLNAEAAAGDVLIAINGNGEVRLGRARLDALNVRISGTGDVGVDGTARRADLSLNGAGTIRVREVTERPRVAMAGAGSIEVGNWR